MTHHLDILMSGKNLGLNGLGWLTFFFFSRLDCVYGVQSNLC